MSNKKCYSINTLIEFKNLIKYKNNKNKILVIFIKNYLIRGFGIQWLKNLVNLIEKNYFNYKIKLYVDAGTNHGLSVLILKENIDYLKLRSDKIVLAKIKQIAKKNKVLLNPNFDVVEVSKIKNYKNIKI